MANIRIDLQSPIVDGQSVIFKAPVNCSQDLGLAIYYQVDGETVVKNFQFADSHGNNVGKVNLFAKDVLVKVILHVETGKAYVQNADTNAYLEKKFAEKLSIDGNGIVVDPIILKKGVHYGDRYPSNPAIGQLFFISLEAVNS